MREIILKKRYPHSREEDITDAFMRGYEKGKADRPQGEWIDKGWKGDWQFETDGRGNCWYEYECSECGFRNKGGKSNFCPNCGARMRPRLQGKHFDSIIIDESAMKGADDDL